MANGLLANAQESHTDLLWAGSGGFDTVHHDDTLTGMGTELYPLGVNSAILNDAPWLSAAKEIAPTQTLQPGQYIQALSSLTVSGYKNHCVAVKGGGFLFPTVDQLQEWVGTSGFLPTSSFENYTAYNENNITNLYNSAGNLINSSYYLIDNKLDTSASGFFYPMTGNPSGFLTEHQSLEDYYKKTETSSKEEISAALKDKLDNDFSGNFYPMTGNPSGFLTAHQDISNLATKDELLDTSSFLSASISSISSFVSGNDDKYYPLTGNPSGFLTAHQDLSNYATTSIVNNISSYLSGEIDNKLDKSESANYYPMTGNPSGFLTEHQSLEDYYKKTETSSKEELSSMFATFSADDTYTLVGGYNIDISSDDNLKQTTIYYTGTNGDEEVNNVVRQYSADGTWLTAHQDISNLMPKSESANFYPMTGNPSGFLTAHQSLTNYYTKTDTSSKQEISAALEYISANAGHSYTGDAPIYVNNETNHIGITGEALSAGPNVDIFSSGGHIVISATGGGEGDMDSTLLEYNDKNQITGYDGEPFAGAEYTGISPIDVNNDTHQISAKGVPFGVQEPLFFVQDDNEAVIIGCSAGGGIASGEYLPLSALSAEIGSGNSAAYDDFTSASLTSRAYVFGTDNTYSSGCAVFGYNNSASRFSIDSFVHGYNNQYAARCFVNGYENNCEDNDYLPTFGSYNYSHGSFIVGRYNSGYYTKLIAGEFNSATNFHPALAIIGEHNLNSTQSNAVMLGSYNSSYCSLSEKDNYILGKNNSAGGNAFIYGSNNTARNAITLGIALSANGSYGLTIGKFNEPVDNALFVVGNGNQYTRKNGFFIDANGNVSAAGKISANGVELGAGGGGTTYTGDAQGALDEVYANSGVWLTAHQSLADYQTTAGMTAYQTKLDGVNNIVYTASLPATPDANTLYLIPEA